MKFYITTAETRNTREAQTSVEAEAIYYTV